jgi:hypothetical protein
MAENLSDIPLDLAERFAKSSAELVEALQDAMTKSAQNPELAGTPAFRAWQTKALPLLQEKNSSIQAAIKRFADGDVHLILALAEDKRSLAKDLDGFPLTFAGPEHLEALESLQTAVVTAAYQLCEAAGIP